MKVTFLVPDLGWPIVGIAARMAKYIGDQHEVEIVGPSLWGGQNAMYWDEFACRTVDCPKIYRFPDYFRETRKLARATQGDVIVAMKAFGSNLPAALRAKRERGCRVVAYLDEWDGAVPASWSMGTRIRQWMQDWMHPCNSLYVPWVERRLPECDLRLGTTRFLQRKFNCRIFPIGVDTDRFKPQDPSEVDKLKTRLGLRGFKLVVFGGVMRPHKGVEIFAEALAKLGRTDVRLVILGPQNEHVRDMLNHPLYGRFISCPATGPEEARLIHHDMPLYLGMGDALIVPLADTVLSQSQLPCKVFEAMAMGKPIVANAVSDLPEVLEGCGRLIAPNRVDLAIQAFAEILDDPQGGAHLGRQARARCLEKYGAETSRRTLLALLDELR